LDYVNRKERDLREKASRFKEIIPSLIAKQKEAKEKQEVKVYVGYEGIKTFYDETLRRLGKGDEFLVITKDNLMWEDEGYSNLIINFHKRRLEKKMHVKCLFNSMDGKFKLRKFFPNKKPYYELREIVFDSPTGLMVFKDTVAIMTWGKTIRVFVIICQEVVDQYKKFFYELWKGARKE